MSASSPGLGRRTWRRPPAIANPYLRYGLYAAVAAYFAWATGSLELSWARVAQGVPRAVAIFSRALPPDFSRRSLMVDGFVESIQIAIVATLIGVILSLLFGILAARNVVPRAVYLLGRAVIAVARSFHPIIVAIIFVKAVGFGPFAGVLTLIVYSIGFVGKLMAEAIEEIDPGQVEAVRATGGGFLKVLAYAVFPQVLPRQVGLSIYQLDSNLRASAVVGIVGAGGIGGTLMNSFRRFDYDFALAILIVMIVIILFSEAFSGRIRRSLT
ncbi:MAG TPA: phosphonate ABC transporter, permease protein PhnE [Trueperaceae bacterium]|nr:phosphonate ABC transporter, permease protein PhnE [Trueperaceae bacterium]